MAEVKSWLAVGELEAGVLLVASSNLPGYPQGGWLCMGLGLRVSQVTKTHTCRLNFCCRYSESHRPHTGTRTEKQTQSLSK